MTSVAELLADHSAVLTATSRTLEARIGEAVTLVVGSLQHGGKLLFCGNGGSAADAQHLAAEFEGRFLKERRPLPAMALSTNSSTITAIGNDYGFDQVFARAVEAHGRKGDVLFCISTSGNSPNTVRAAEVAVSKGLKVVSLTGDGGGLLATVSDVLLDVPSRSTPRIQEMHILIGHVLCEIVENHFAGPTEPPPPPPPPPPPHSPPPLAPDRESDPP